MQNRCEQYAEYSIDNFMSIHYAYVALMQNSEFENFTDYLHYMSTLCVETECAIDDCTYIDALFALFNDVALYKAELKTVKY